MRKVFDTVILGHQDPMKEMRHQVISSIGLDKNDISQQVIQILNRQLEIQPTPDLVEQ